MTFTYDEHIEPYSSNFILIEMTDDECKKINDFVNKLILVKKQEVHHQIDDISEFKRFYNGTLGEFALEKFLKTKGIINWTIGNSAFYNVSDLKNIGVDVGVKTVEYGLFPIIFKTNDKPEIINIAWKQKYVYICGIATPEILNQYQSIDLVMDMNLRNRGTKTGFYGFNKLEPLLNLDSLKEKYGNEEETLRKKQIRKRLKNLRNENLDRSRTNGNYMG